MITDKTLKIYMANTKHTIPAKPCYSHIGGRLGTLLMEQFIQKGWIKKKEESDRNFYITPKGVSAFTDLGIDLTQIPIEDLK